MQPGTCHVDCGFAKSCVVHCPPGTAGTENCDIPGCASGKPKICQDGTTIVCGTQCP
jgi:hypothetical protein